MIYDDGIGNEFEHAHQKGLTRGFDLGWSYKGRFDRQLIREHVDSLPVNSNKRKFAYELINMLRDNNNNREFITDDR